MNNLYFFTSVKILINKNVNLLILRNSKYIIIDENFETVSIV